MPRPGARGHCGCHSGNRTQWDWPGPRTLLRPRAPRAMGQLLGTRRAGGLRDSQGLRVSGQVKARAHQPASRDAPHSASVHKLSDGVPSRGDSAGMPPTPHALGPGVAGFNLEAHRHCHTCPPRGTRGPEVEHGGPAKLRVMEPGGPQHLSLHWDLGPVEPRRQGPRGSGRGLRPRDRPEGLGVCTEGSGPGGQRGQGTVPLQGTGRKSP